MVEELKAVFDPRGGSWVDGKYVPSLLAAIGDVIERHMIAIGFLDQPKDPTRHDIAKPARLAVGGDAAAGEQTGGRSPFRQCPKCGTPALLRQEGCNTCTNCDYSKCG